MKQLVILIIVTAVSMGFSTSVRAIEIVSSGAVRIVESGTAGVTPVSTADTPPEPIGEGEPPGGYGGGSTGGGGTSGGGTGGGGTGGGVTGGGGSEDSVILTGANSYTSETNTLANATLASTTSDQNVILAQTNSYVTVSNCVLNKSGDTSSEDNSNFFALNAVVAAKTASTVCIENSTLNSNAEGANCLFASGSGSTIYAYNCTLASTCSSSRGLDATYKGKVIASKMSIDTKKDHCAALATDRGNGYISATDSRLTTAGQGSPLIYSTGVIEVNGVTGTATGAQIAGIEGLSTIRIRNSDLTGSAEKASESVTNGVIIYQSNSGDYTAGTATFEVSDSTLASSITNGALFYITHSEAVITVQNTEFEFDTDKNYLIKAAGNDGENGWGTKGSNGAGVVFTAIDQTLAGNISVDGISSNDLYLVNSKYTGAFVQDTTYTGDGGSDLFIDSNSTWIVTASCTLQNLTAEDGATIVDGNGNLVSIVGANGTKHVTGTSALTITVSDYKTDSFVATNITDFAISRTAFEAMYGTSGDGEVEGGGTGTGSGSGGTTGGGADDHNNWTNYFKPYPPANAIVKVKVDGATEYGLPDKDHKYCLDGYWDEENGVKVRLLYVTQESYLFSEGCKSNVWETVITNNAQEVYPPKGVEAIKAQAKSGSTDYLTLKAAVDAAKARAKISLYGNVTLTETLTVTNSITLDLDGTNVLTLGSALTNAFHFTAGGTVSNGTINSSLAANVGGSVLMRFTDCNATLRNLTVNGRGYETVVAHDSSKTPAEKYAAKKVSGSMTCDGLTLTGNGRLLSVDFATATLTNNCSFTADDALASFGGTNEAAVSCSGNGTVTIADGTYASPNVLQSGDLGGKIVVNGGTFSGRIYSWMATGAHTDLEQYANYKARFAFNGGTYDDANIAFADADSRTLDTFTKVDGVSIEIPSGYVWENNVLVGNPFSAGVASDSYGDAQSATNAAAKINNDKTSCIVIPTGVEEGSKTVYLSKVEATVTSDNCVVVDLTPEARSNEQVFVDAAVTSETAVAALTSTNLSATATISPTTPGLYYWITGGTDVDAVTNAGAGVLSTNGGSVELAKPTLDASKGKAFFRISAGVTAPASSDDD